MCDIQVRPFEAEAIWVIVSGQSMEFWLSPISSILLKIFTKCSIILKQKATCINFFLNWASYLGGLMMSLWYFIAAVVTLGTINLTEFCNPSHLISTPERAYNSLAYNLDLIRINKCKSAQAQARLWWQRDMSKWPAEQKRMKIVSRRREWSWKALRNYTSREVKLKRYGSVERTIDSREPRYGSLLPLAEYAVAAHSLMYVAVHYEFN